MSSRRSILREGGTPPAVELSAPPGDGAALRSSLATVSAGTDTTSAPQRHADGEASSTKSIVAACERVISAAAQPGRAMTQGSRITLIRALENLKDAACALQAEVAVDVVAAEVALAEIDARDAVDQDASARVREQALERRVARARRSAVGQVGLARRESPHRAGVLVGTAEALVGEMPCTLAALRSGALNEHRAVLLVRETACLDVEGRREVDREVCGDPAELEGVGTRRLVALAAKHAYRLDPASFVRRAERSATERNVTLRPAPGSMTYLTALLPMAQGVGVLANLRRQAETARATGDERSLGQVMADTLVERATGQPTADAVPVAVSLIMSDASLLAAGHEPAVLDGAHQVPAQLARELVARAMELHVPESSPPHENLVAAPSATGGRRSGDACEVPAESLGSTFASPQGRSTSGPSPSPGVHGPPGASQPVDYRPRSTPVGGSTRDAQRLGAWVRRVYTDAGGDLVAMDSRARTFPAGLARLLRVRDQGLCRTPWCDAPIAHTDHITARSAGGATSASNGQGLCAGCNYTKQAPGWTQATQQAPGWTQAAQQTRGSAGGTEAGPGTGSAGHGATRHTVTTTTPAGHAYASTAPPPLAPLDMSGHRCSHHPDSSGRPDTAIEAAFRAIIDISYTEPTSVAVAVALRRAGSEPGGGGANAADDNQPGEA